MSGYAKFERPQLLRSAAGLAYYESAAFIQGVEDVVNGHATTTITRGMVVCIDTTAGNVYGFIPRWGYSTAGSDVNFATTCKISVVPSVADTSLQVPLGIALENIPPGATGKICTDGLCAVLCAGTMVKGNYAITSAAGVGTVGPSATVVVGRTLGLVVIINTASGAGIGATTECLVRVCPQ
jgi:hypothetical protein